MDKQLLRDRISELKFKKEEYENFQKIYLPTIFSLTMIFLTVFSYYAAKSKLQDMVIAFFIWFLFMVVMWLLNLHSSKRELLLRNKIQNNYYLLLGRKTKVFK